MYRGERRLTLISVLETMVLHIIIDIIGLLSVLRSFVCVSFVFRRGSPFNVYCFRFVAIVRLFRMMVTLLPGVWGFFLRVSCVFLRAGVMCFL